MGIGNDRSERGGEKEKTKQVQRISSRFFFFLPFQQKSSFINDLIHESDASKRCSLFSLSPFAQEVQ